jgi:hypothetical protein
MLLEIELLCDDCHDNRTIRPLLLRFVASTHEFEFELENSSCLKWDAVEIASAERLCTLHSSTPTPQAPLSLLAKQHAWSSGLEAIHAIRSNPILLQRMQAKPPSGHHHFWA